MAVENVSILLSACIIMRDEALALPRCLSSLARVTDEICVIDTGSSDASVEIARSHGARVREVAWQEDFSAARNAALEMANGRWVLVIDADEAVHPEDGQLLRRLLEASDLEAYFVQVLSYVGQERVDHLVRHQVVRLIRNRPAYRYRGKVHEGLDLTGAQGAVAFSDVRLLHYGYLDDVKRRTNKAARNLTLLSRAVAEDPENPYLRFNIGTEYLNGGDYETALEHYETAARQARPEHIYAPLLTKRRIACLQALGRHFKAVQVARQAQKDFPHYTDVVFLKAISLLQMGQLATALRTFEACVALGEPSGVSQPSEEVGVGGFKALWWIGQLHERMHHREDALAGYREAFVREPSHRASLERLVALLRERASEAEVARSLDLRPDDDEVVVLAAEVFRERGEYEALQALLADRAPGQPDLSLYWQGVALVRRGQISEGLTLLRGIGPDSPLAERAWLEQIAAAWLEQDFTRAAELLEDAEREFRPSNAVAIYRAVQRCLREDPGDSAALPQTDEARALILDLAHAFRARGLEDALSRLTAAALAWFGNRFKADLVKSLDPSSTEPARAWPRAVVESLLEGADQQDFPFDAWMAMARLAQHEGRLALAARCYARAAQVDTCWAKAYLEPATALRSQAEHLVHDAGHRFPGAEPLAKLAGLLAREGGAPTGGLGT